MFEHRLRLLRTCHSICRVGDKIVSYASSQKDYSIGRELLTGTNQCGEGLLRVGTIGVFFLLELLYIIDDFGVLKRTAGKKHIYLVSSVACCC